ncbi:MAG: DUF302 domain-containing protein [Pseudomonadota bacterium]
MSWGAPAPAIAAADDFKLYDFNGEFGDATFGVENAIVDRGLVIDYVSHVGAMLNRTMEDVGGETVIFANANIYLFCSAKLSRKVMEADPTNVAHCPYGVFVTEATEGGAVQIGYRTMPEGPMKEVEALLDEIAQDAAGL